MRDYAKMIERAGIKVTSSWLDEPYAPNMTMDQCTQAFLRYTAKVDLQDIWRSSAVLFFSEDPTIGIPRGGRHVEFGYALGLGIPIYVIGPRENIFHYLPSIECFDSLEDFLEVAR